ncbi:MAG: lytic transglycosylase domain-containing protein [Candidatus Gastranaerophilaceae bacterium]
MKSCESVSKYLISLLSLCLIFFNCLGSYALSTYTLSSLEIKEKIIKRSLIEGVDPALSLSLVKQESNFETNAKSYVGAIGLFQIMPATAKDLGIDPYSINDNIKGGIKYIKMLKDQFGSNELALAAYNAGPGAVQRYGNNIPPYGETRTYVSNIMQTYVYLKNNPDPLIEKINGELAEGNINSVQKIFELNATKSNQANKLTLFGYLFKVVGSVFS